MSRATRRASGDRGLNNPANTPAGRAVVRGVDELQSAKHVVHTLEQVAAEAEESLRTGGVERRRELERKLASGAQLSDTETVEAVRVLDELAARWTKSQKKEDFRNAALWGQALRAARTEQARGLGATRRQGPLRPPRWPRSWSPRPAARSAACGPSGVAWPRSPRSLPAR